MSWFMIILGAVFILWGFVSLAFPRTIWRKTEAWKYENPDANEPSESGYLSKAGSLFVSGLVLVFIGIWWFETS